MPALVPLQPAIIIFWSHNFPLHGGKRDRWLVLEQLLTSRKRNCLCEWMVRVLCKWLRTEDTGKCRGVFLFFGPSGTFTCWGCKLFDTCSMYWLICPINVIRINMSTQKHLRRYVWCCFTENKMMKCDETAYFYWLLKKFQLAINCHFSWIFQ